jgi:D-amino peptidase
MSRMGFTARLKKRGTVCAEVLFWIFLVQVGLHAQDSHPFKVFISADMEGVAGIVSETQIRSDGFNYGLGRQWMTGEVNAAIGAAFQAGASEVVVTDGHGAGTNLLPGELDARATLISGFPMPGGMMQGLDGSFAAVVFVGYHARGSTAKGVLAHTYVLPFETVRLNGKEVGEYGLNAALAGFYNVPVVFASGDQALVEQAKEFISGIEARSVKEGFSDNSARTLSPEAARSRIAEGVKVALSRRDQISPVRLSTPVALEVELAQTDQADAAMLVPGMIRVSARVVRYVAPNMGVAYQVSMLLDRLATAGK